MILGLIILLSGSAESTTYLTRTIESAPKIKQMEFDAEEVKARLNSILIGVFQRLFEGKYQVWGKR